MNEPLVTIGIPVYNGMPYLSEAVESTLRQSYSALEIIISDNGSDDGTEQYCRELRERDARVRYYRSDVNRGAGSNFNQVLLRARGAYFKWLASDDTIEPDFVSESLLALASCPGSTLAVPDARFVDLAGNVLGDTDDFVDAGILSLLGVKSPVRSFGAMTRLVLADGRAAMPIVFALGTTEAFKCAGRIGAYYAADCVMASSFALSGRLVPARSARTYFRRHHGSSSSGSRSDEATTQQAFYDPRVKNRMIAFVNYRRRYFEFVRAPLRAQMSQRTRIVAVAAAAGIVLQEIGVRAVLRFGRTFPIRRLPTRKSVARW